MTSRCVAILCLLFGFGLSAEVPCKSMTYTLSAEPMCDVAVPVLVNFEIKSIGPSEICNATENVCLRIPAAVNFLGAFNDGDILSVSGFTKETAQIPVADIKTDRDFALPPVAMFMDNGNGVAVEVLASQPLEFVLPGTNPGIGATAAGCTETAVGQPCNGFCCAIAGNILQVWGKKPAVTKAININATPKKVYIPIVVKKATDQDPMPTLLKVPSGGLTPAATAMAIPFLPAVIKNGETELPPIAITATSCAAGITQCYKINMPILIAEFQGKMPSAPITYTIKGAERQIAYTFGNAGNAMKSGVMVLVMATTAFFVSNF